MKLGAAIGILLAAAGGICYAAYKWENGDAVVEGDSKVDKPKLSMVSNLAESKQVVQEKPTETTIAAELERPAPAQAQAMPDITKANQEVIAAFTESTEQLLAGKQDTYAVLTAGIKLKSAAEAHSPHLSMRLIMAINDALVEFSGKEFGHITKTARDSRRKVRAEATMDQYIELVLRSTQDIEMMLVNNMTKVCEDCGVTMEKYDISNQYWAQINPQFSLLSMLMLDKMKLMMEGTKKTTVADALAVFDFQIAEYPRVKVQVPNPQLTPMIKQSVLTDMVFEQLGFEEEDYIKTPGLEQNMQFRQKAEQLATMIQQEAMMMQGGMGGMMPGMF